MISNVWNKIVSWFKDLSERNKMILSFNESAREAFVSGTAPALLKASFSKGDASYKHAFSKWMNSGFRIKVYSGRMLTKDEMLFIGNIILSDEQLVRRLVVLGWDTLEIHGENATYGYKWKLIDYMHTLNFIN